jgi:hypothetical protein
VRERGKNGKWKMEKKNEEKNFNHEWTRKRKDTNRHEEEKREEIHPRIATNGHEI